MQPANDTDFEVEVKFDSQVQQRYQDQGIIIEESSSNWMRVDIFSDGTNTRIFAAVIVDGSPSVKINKTITPGAPIYLNVLRSGDNFSVSYSYNGVDWTVAGAFTHVLSVNAVGPYAGNHYNGATSPAHTAVIDYFFNMQSPIEPEDGAAGPVLNVNVSGGGTVSVDPEQSFYTCDELVELTATADAGWQFAGWSGDLSGSDNPASLTMDADKTVTATFSETGATQYTLTASVVGGNGTLSPTSGSYDAGTPVS